MDFARLCRACLTSKESFEYRLFENVSVEVYEFCTSLEVNKNDVLPKCLCEECVKTMTKFYEFKQMCSRSQKMLLTMPKQHYMESLAFNQDQTKVAKDNPNQNMVHNSNELGIKKNDLKEESLEPGCESLVQERESLVEEHDTFQVLPKQEDVKDEQDSGPTVWYSDYDTNEVASNSNSSSALHPSKRLKKKRSSMNLCAEPENAETKKDRVCLSTMDKASSGSNILNTTEKLDPGELHKKEIEKKKKRNTRKKAEYSYSCDICKRKFNLEERLQAHKLNFHEGKESKIECGVCGLQLKNWESLRYHRQWHQAVSLASLRCALCGKVFKTPLTLQKHRKLHETTRKPVMCYVCGIYLKSAATFQAHIKTHNQHRERSFVCKFCDKKFYSSALLTSHVTDLHGSKSYTCDHCQLVFARRNNIIQHIRIIHLGVKPYRCEYCPKTFARLIAQQQHTRVHTGERPYPCGVCAKRFASKPQLVNHTRIHTGEKPYTCKICDKSFIQRSTLVRHMKVHK